MPHGTDEAEDRHSNFYDAWVNLVGVDSLPLHCDQQDRANSDSEDLPEARDWGSAIAPAERSPARYEKVNLEIDSRSA